MLAGERVALVLVVLVVLVVVLVDVLELVVVLGEAGTVVVVASKSVWPWATPGTRAVTKTASSTPSVVAGAVRLEAPATDGVRPPSRLGEPTRQPRGQ